MGKKYQRVKIFFVRKDLKKENVHHFIKNPFVDPGCSPKRLILMQITFFT